MIQADLLDWKPPAPASILGDRDGSTFDHKKDVERLNAQARRVWDVICDGRWYSLAEISRKTFNPKTGLPDPEASISARLRDLRKPKFGGFRVDETRVSAGLHRYRLVLE